MGIILNNEFAGMLPETIVPVNITQPRLVGKVPKNKSETMWQEVIMAACDVLSWNLFGGIEGKIMKSFSRSARLDLNPESP
jgi:hypothetical protein